MRAFVQVQDSRLWGGENPALALGTLDGDADQLDLHQAYFELDSLGGQPLAVRVGRQELAYGNQRLVGAVGWSNVGRSFDAARLRWASGGLTADVFAAQLVSAAGAGAAQALVGAFAAWAPEAGPAAGHTAEVFAFVDADDARLEAGPDAGARLRQRTTLGVRAHGRLGLIGYDAELAGQTGAMATTPEAPRDDVRAWLASGEISADAGPVTLAAGATRLSGDADPVDGVDRRFDTLFATNHAFYGAMDYFPRLLGPAGLDDLYLAASASPARLWRLTAAGHLFSAAADLGDGRAFGQELDLGAGYALAPAASVSFGVSVFHASERFAAGETTAWAFLSSRVGF